jgi:hypothetical protein
MRGELSADIASFIRGRGWALVRTTEAGGVDLWSLPNTPHEMYLPRTMRRGSFEATDVIERIAAAHKQGVQEIESAVNLQRFDITRFRIDNDLIDAASIPLETGATVISSAFGMIRAAATTARRPRQSIGSNYSRLGDELVRGARLGHTELGSYIFPVLTRVSEPLPPETLTLPDAMFDSVRPESDERRIIRTLAQAVGAFERQIIRPGLEPRAADLTPVVIAGGSKEIFAQLGRALAEPSVSWLETSFTWAPTESIAEGTPERILIPSDARDLITQTVRLLSTPERDPLRIITGPITQIAHVPGDLFGEIAIQTPNPNGSRVGRVEVRVRAEELTQLHYWMDTATTVVAQGTVERRPGRPARLREVTTPRALSDTISGV